MDMTDRQRQVWELHQTGKSGRAIAEQLGVHQSRINRTIAMLKLRAALSPGIVSALEQTGIEPEHARFGYRKVKHADGSFNTVMWRMPEMPAESVTDRIRAALEGMDAAPPIVGPEAVDADLLTVYGLADVHMGMKSHERNGEPYDRAIAKTRLREATASLVHGQIAHTGVVLIAGDFFHANDQSAMTPRSKHVLDVDGDYFDALEDGVQIAAECIELAASAHDQVAVVILLGNHDPASALALMFALAERYRDNPRIAVEKTPSLMWGMSWGACLLAAHHGHDVKPEDIVHQMAEHPDWSACRYRYLKTGHRHKYSQMMIGSVEWESMSPVTARDAWAAGKAFVTRPALRASTLHKRRGEVFRRTVNL
jgi:DNA-binding CsgD family transcriptional regulator